MKSICIKTVDENIVNFLLDEFQKLPTNVYLSYYRFKIYDNVIIHYPYEDVDYFFNLCSLILKKCIEKFYEEKFIDKILKKNYFYLSNNEQEYIVKITKKVLQLPDEKIGNKSKILEQCLKEYIKENKNIVLEGVVNFRILEYKNILDKLVEVSVISYLNLIAY